MDSYYVYRHTAPNGKVYIGITRNNNPSRRWGANGNKYKRNNHFWNAICKYGWDNIEHDILFAGLCADMAKETEKKLISHYKSNNPEYGYNYTSGGDNVSSSFNEEVRIKLSEHTKSLWKCPEMRNRIISKLRGHVVTKETREKISASKVGKPLGPSKLRGRHISAEHRNKLRNHIPWNAGKTKHTAAGLMSSSCKLKGRIFSDETKRKMSESHKYLIKSGYDPIWVNNGEIETIIDKSLKTYYCTNGFSDGRLNKKDIYITNGSETIKIQSSDLSHYENLGWRRGRLESTGDKISKANQKYWYCYDNLRFTSMKKLIAYMRDHGYPTISSTSIDKIISGVECKSYQSLQGAISVINTGGFNED